MGVIWGLSVAVLGTLAVVVPSSVLTPPMNATGPSPAPSCSGTPADDPGEPAGPVNTAPSPATSPSGSGQALTVEVPPGTVYLEPNRVVVRLPADGKPVRLAPVLVADLRETTPGWQLTATIAKVDAGERGGSPIELLVAAGLPEPIVGQLAGMDGSGPIRLAVGGCAVLAQATPGHGWGSYNVTPTVAVAGAGSAEGDRELVLELQVRTPSLASASTSNL